MDRITFGPHFRQYCLVLRPNVPIRAWLIYWHGGGWQFGRPEQFKATAKPWLDAGYGVIIPSYRRLPFYQFESIRADTVAALNSCRQYWEQHQDDPSLPVVLLGMSAGGHLASIAGLDQSILVQAGWTRRSISGVVAAGAVLDLDLMHHNPLVRVLAGTPGTDSFKRANPISHIHSDAPPFLIVHGKKDGMTNYEMAIRFQARYQRLAAAELKLITLDNGTHLDAGRWMYLAGIMQDSILQQAEQWLPISKGSS